MSALGAAVQRELGEAISQVLARHGEYTSKWIAIVETVDGKGERGLWPTAGEGCLRWDIVGMLQHALHMEQAATLRGMYEGGDDDG